MRKIVLLGMGLLLIGQTAAAQGTRTEDLAGGATSSASRPHGGQDAICFDTPTSIPAVGGISTVLEIPCPQATIEDLDLLVQIKHTWVGDLSATLDRDGSGPVTVFDRPGLPAQGAFGCAGDDIDAVIDDEAIDPIEDECEPSIPTIQGAFVGGDPPDDTLMATWDGEDLCGTWTLFVEDHAGADVGFIEQWCLIPGPPDPPGGDVPATTGVGAICLALLLLTGGAVMARRSRVDP